jgi:hypothetical protein
MCVGIRKRTFLLERGRGSKVMSYEGFWRRGGVWMGGLGSKLRVYRVSEIAYERFDRTINLYKTNEMVDLTLDNGSQVC